MCYQWLAVLFLCLCLCLCVRAGDASEAIRLRLSKPVFTWRSANCPVDTPLCKSVAEPHPDMPGWTDNCICSDGTVDVTTWRYTSAGVNYPGMRSVHLYEPSYLISGDNYLYMPNSGDWGYVFSHIGAVPGLNPNSDCILMNDGSTSTWSNNYFCWYPLGEMKYNVPGNAAYMGSFEKDRSTYTFYMAFLVYYYVTSYNAANVSRTDGPYIVPNVITYNQAAVMLRDDASRSIVYESLSGAKTARMDLLGTNSWSLPVAYSHKINGPFSVAKAEAYTLFLTYTATQLVSTYCDSTSCTPVTCNLAGITSPPSCYYYGSMLPGYLQCVYSTSSAIYAVRVGSVVGMRGCYVNSLITSATSPSRLVATGTPNNNEGNGAFGGSYALAYVSLGEITVIGTTGTNNPNPSHIRSTHPVPDGTLIQAIVPDIASPQLGGYIVDAIGTTTLNRCSGYTTMDDTLHCSPLDMSIAAGKYFIYTADPRVRSSTMPRPTAIYADAARHTNSTIIGQYTSAKRVSNLIKDQLGGTYMGTIVNGGLAQSGSSAWLNQLWDEFLPLLPSPVYPNLGADDVSSSVIGFRGYSHSHVLRYLEAQNIHGRDLSGPIKSVSPDKFIYTYNGSLAYHVDIGDYMVLNMHAKPSPVTTIVDDGSSAHTIEDKIVASYTNYQYQLRSSIPWLRMHLENAQRDAERVVVNIHWYPYQGEWDATEFNSLLALYEANVVAVFSGNYLDKACESRKVGSTQIPVIYIGSRDQQTYLVVRLSKGDFEVVSLINGYGTDYTAINSAPTGPCRTYTFA